MIKAWLAQALSVPCQTHALEVAGATIRYLSWAGPRNAPGIVLVHGMFGHAHWWDPIAPFLARDYNVVALDLSGMGDSDSRPAYRMAHHAEEIVAVTRHAGFRGAALIGHSYGGSTAVVASLGAPGLFGQLVILDSRIPFPGAIDMSPGPPVPKYKRNYPTAADALARFRLIPPDPMADPVVLSHIAKCSLREADEGWTWKFDDMVSASSRDIERVDPEKLDLPVVFISGEESFVTSAEQLALTRRVFPAAEFLTLADAGHHLMIDQPIALTRMLQEVLFQSDAVSKNFRSEIQD
jgi:pimeloyl-ACP methyl ester carboxylesterase